MTDKDALRMAAAALGKLGGMAGRGEAKRRTPDHYRAAGLKSAKARALKKAQKKNSN